MDAETPVMPGDVVLEEAPPELTAAILLDEHRAEARAQRAQRLAALEAISPSCVRVLTVVDSQEVRCGHKLNRHDPCSQCVCPGYLDVDGSTGADASVALTGAHPDLFPLSDELVEEALIDPAAQ